MSFGVPLHCVADILLADQLIIFIIFYKTCWPSERRPSPFVVAYMVPRPSNQFPLIDSHFFLIKSARGMSPYIVVNHSWAAKD